MGKPLSVDEIWNLASKQLTNARIVGPDLSDRILAICLIAEHIGIVEKLKDEVVALRSKNADLETENWKLKMPSGIPGDDVV